jgi:Na+-driven multidrug efflux pump
VIMNHALKENGGDLAIGASGIISSIAMLLVMLIIGIAQGMQPIVGFNHGAGHHDRVLATLRLSIIVSTLITGVGCIVSLLFPRLIVSVFSTDAELVSITDNGLRLTMLVFFVVGSQITISQFFQSIGVAWKAMFLSLSRQVLFLIPAILLFPPIWGLDGVWLAQPFSDFIAAVTAWGFLWYHVKNVKNKG